MKKDYFYWSVVLIELYATIHSFMYIPKVLGILGIFAYVWYWGGFEKQDNGEHAHLTILENILEEQHFEADNEKLPEDLDIVHQLLMNDIITKVLTKDKNFISGNVEKIYEYK